YHSHDVGINTKCGMTHDGTALDKITGNSTNPRRYTFGSKEAFQLALLAIALNGSTPHGYDPLDYFHIPIELTAAEKAIINTGDPRLDTVLVTLYRKMDTLEKFNKALPGYGGYIPFLGVRDNGLETTVKTDTDVGSLDDGLMVWGVYAVSHELGKTRYKDHVQLSLRYRKWFDMMADNAVTMFWNRTALHFAMSARMKQNDIPVASNTYWSNSPYASQGPLDGEPMGIFGDMFGTFESQELRDKTWNIFKVNKVDWTTPSGVITVQKGWTYSPHESYKYLLLPYQDVEIQRRLLSNCEKARTWYSNLNGYPGMFGASYNSSSKYFVDVGVPPLSAHDKLKTDYYTPYGAFPTIMANHPVGLVWYNNMLKGPAMQGPYGSTESGMNDGTSVSSIISWDTKTSIVAILGGIGDIVRDALILDCKYQTFIDRIQTTYTKAFPVLKGEDIPYAMPKVTAPANAERADFTLCS
ncbi:hypothetical protein SAMD00019534_084980, partial [Acytostelium subglobosum LB1]|uniref:hypothetical protein n=1 Tax=Acytostelium subglobosum LB1 TaxID=1410327 RepID=UPI00064484CD